MKTIHHFITLKGKRLTGTAVFLLITALAKAKEAVSKEEAQSNETHPLISLALFSLLVAVAIFIFLHYKKKDMAKEKEDNEKLMKLRANLRAKNARGGYSSKQPRYNN